METDGEINDLSL